MEVASCFDSTVNIVNDYAFDNYLGELENLKSDPNLLKKLYYLLLYSKPFKKDQKWFLFHLKSSFFRSQDI